MVTENQTIGICCTCYNMEICINIGNTETPKWFCEGFENNRSSFPEYTDQDMSFVNTNTPEYNTDKYTGICINCENCETCNLQVPDSEVWHCEEHR